MIRVVDLGQAHDKALEKLHQQNAGLALVDTPPKLDEATARNLEAKLDQQAVQVMRMALAFAQYRTKSKATKKIELEDLRKAWEQMKN